MGIRIRIVFAVVLTCASLVAIWQSVSAIVGKSTDFNNGLVRITDLVVLRTEFEVYSANTTEIRAYWENYSDTTINPRGHVELSRLVGEDWIFAGGVFASLALIYPIQPGEKEAVHLCFDHTHTRRYGEDQSKLFIGDFIQQSENRREFAEIELIEGLYRIRDEFQISYSRRWLSIQLVFPVYSYFNVN